VHSRTEPAHHTVSTVFILAGAPTWHWRASEWHGTCSHSLMLHLPASRLVVACLLCLASFAACCADKVVLQLGWAAEPEFGGFFEALQTGLYGNHGIDLDLRLGNPQSNTTQLLLAGRADFIVAPSSDALNAAREGLPVVVVAAIFQRDPRVIISHRGAGNDSLASMRGKPIMIAASDRVTIWPFLRGRFGFTDDQLRPYAFNTGPFMANPNAIQQGYLTNEPFALQKLGAAVNVFLLADHGYDSYGATIITTRRLMAMSPDLVRRFVAASIKGWQAYLFGDPSPGNAFIKQNNPDMGDDRIAYSIARMKQSGLVDSGDARTNGIGAMSDARWKSMVAQLTALGIYPPTMDYHAIYTLEFVNHRVAP